MGTLIKFFWENFQGRKWEIVKSLLDESFFANFPQSGEIFDREHYVEMNRKYPGNWQIEVQRIFKTENLWISEVKIVLDDHIDWGIGLFKIKNGKIFELCEYWAESFSEPEWRKKLRVSRNQKIGDRI